MSHLICGGQSVEKLCVKVIVCAYFFVALLMGSAMVLPSPTWAADGFTVQNIAVDAKGATATAARDAGLLQGQVSGLRQLLQRLTQPADHARLPTVGTADILPFVLSVSVDEEKTQPTRYVAQLSVRYQPAAVRSLLQAHGLSYVEPHRAILTLPLLQTEGRNILWEDPNPWRQAWASLPVNPVIPLVVPLGGIEDVTELPTNKANNASADDLGAIMQRHDAVDAIVIVADLDHNASPMQLGVSLRGIGPSVPDVEIPRSFTAREGETMDALLTRAANAVNTAITSSYKAGSTMNYAQTGSVRAAARFAGGLAEWQAIRERLGMIPAIRRIDIDVLGRSEALLNLQIIGDRSILPAILSQHDLSFTPENGTQLAIITLKTPVAPPLPPSPSEMKYQELEIPE